MWVWVLSITILSIPPENVTIAKFDTQQDCQKALLDKKQQEALKGKEVVGTCYYRRVDKKGWW